MKCIQLSAYHHDLNAYKLGDGMDVQLALGFKCQFKLCSRFEVITAEWGFRSSGMWPLFIVWVVWFLTFWRKRLPSSLSVKQSNFTFMRLSIVCFWAGCELQTHFFCCWQNVNGCDSCIELHKLCLLWIVKMKLSGRPNVGVIRFWG